jgi:serine/threonine protein kinase
MAAAAAPGPVRGVGALGVVRETGVAGVLVKSFGQQFDFLREAALWRHTVERMGGGEDRSSAWKEVCAGLPFLGATDEGILLCDGGDTLYASAPELRRRDRFDGFALRRFVARLRRILVSVHRRAGIEHRDLNPLNILVAKGADPQPTLIDLTNSAVPGFERTTTKRHTLRVLRASPLVRSPEETLGIETRPFAHDAWALGVLVVWLMTGVVYTGPSESGTASSRSSGTASSRSSGTASSRSSGTASSRSSGTASTDSSSGDAGDAWDAGDAEMDEADAPDEEDSDAEGGREGEMSWEETAAESTSTTGEEESASTTGEEEEESASTTGEESASDPLGQMLRAIRDLVRFYGSPTDLRTRRAWWVALNGTLHPIDGFRGDRVMGAIRRRRWQEVRSIDVLCGRASWKQLRPLASLLLSYDPEVRVQAMHDDRIWRAMEQGSESRSPIAVGGDVRAGFCAPLPLPASLPPLPLPASLPPLPLPASLPRPPQNMASLLAVLFDEVLSPDASPQVSRMATILLDALRQTVYAEEGPERAADPLRPPSPSAANANSLLYAGAVAVVASILVGCFGNPADVVLRPHALSRLATLPHSVVALSHWMMRSRVVSCALAISTRPAAQRSGAV